MATTRLSLDTIEGSQAQKHVPANNSFFKLDALVQASALSRSLTAPPAVPADGDCYIIPENPTGEWVGQVGALALYDAGAWYYHPPGPGWQVFIQDEDLVARYLSGAWASVAGLATTPNGARSDHYILEQELTDLSGASVDTAIQIPDRAIVMCVSTRTTAAVTGAASYDCGIAGEVGKFGGSLGIATGSTNAGVIGPQAFYSPTSIQLVANGGDFTGGSVRVAIHYFLPTPPTA